MFQAKQNALKCGITLAYTKTAKGRHLKPILINMTKCVCRFCKMVNAFNGRCKCDVTGICDSQISKM